MPRSLPADELASRAIERRAIEAVNWGMPAVNYDRMVQAMLGAKGAFNQIVFWSGFSDWKNQTLTPNPDVVYFKPFFDMKNAGRPDSDRNSTGRRRGLDHRHDHGQLAGCSR